MNIAELLNELKNGGIRVDLKGDNLEVSLLKEEIDEGLIQKIRAHKEEIKNYIASLDLKDYSGIPKAKLAASYPLSDAQKRLWILHQFDQESTAYNMPFQLQIELEDIDSFKEALYLLIERHESLRTTVKMNEKGEVQQYITAQEDFKVDFSVESLIGEENITEKTNALIERYSQKLFDLENGPLFNIRLIRLKNHSYSLFLNMHHIISDGWSMQVLSQDLMALYKGVIHNEKPVLPPLNIQYKDYAVWQQANLNSKENQDAKAYWLSHFSGELPILNLPTNLKRPTVKTTNGVRLKTKISKELKEKLEAFSQENKGSLFMTLLAVWKIAVYRYSGAQEIVCGTPVAGRNNAELENQIGFFVNTLALKTKLNPTQNFETFYQSFRAHILEAFNYQNYPFDRLVEDLEFERDTSRSPLFDTMLTLNTLIDAEAEQEESGENQITNLGITPAKFDIDLVFTKATNGLLFEVIYNTDCYQEELVRQLMNHFVSLAEQLMTNQTIALDALNFVQQDEEKQILIDFNNTSIPYSNSQTVIGLFEQQVQNNPNGIALRTNSIEITYLELDQQAKNIAFQIKDQLDLAKNTYVIVKLPKNEQFILVILALQKLGCAYVPIDPDYPAERIAFIQENCSAQSIIDELVLEKLMAPVEVHDFQSVQLKPNDPLYIMYTSGSTGQPKGVKISHKNVISLVQPGDFFPINKEDVFLSTGSISFDLSTYEFWSTLLNGATLALADQKSLMEMEELRRTIHKFKINTIHLIPGWLNKIVEEDISVLDGIEKIITGGDKVSPEHVNTLRAYLPDVYFIQAYGPTENTTFSTTHHIKDEQNPIPIGKPINNGQVYILNTKLLPQPLGVVGEIYLAGEGLSEGYVNRPELNAEKFVANPFVAGTKMYRSGDLGKWLPDGSIQFMGRIDDQVKIRGHRIEVSEVEFALKQVDLMNDAVVLPRLDQEGEKELIAFIVSSKTWNISKIRQVLLAKIPEFMVPAHFVQLETIPLNTNGKVDKKALLKLEVIGMQTSAVYEAPKSDLQKELVRIIANRLGRDEASLGISDNFFDLGANSMKMLRILKEINEQLAMDLKVITLFQFPNIKDLVAHIEATETEFDDANDLPQGVFESEEIAIVGMAGKYPESEDLREFWNHLVDEHELVHHYTEEELKAANFADEIIADPDFVKIDSLLKDPGSFDYGFFGYTKGEGEMMDPQTRILHELSWGALEDAGHVLANDGKNVGVFLTAGDNLNWMAHSMLNPSENVNPFLMDKLAKTNAINTLISYSLNLTGPSLFVDTACSSSLVTVSMACKSLNARECNVALAGGVRYETSDKKGYYFEEGMIHSKDGKCRAFDKNATGTIGGNGAGVVALKRLSDAIKAGDHIYALIKSTATNNDGKRKVGYTAPSVAGQAECLNKAYQQAGIAPNTLSYIEAHGTGTSLGDPIEIEALNKVFGKDEGDKCAIGTVKTNIGHLDSAAGITGLIKTALALKNKILPGSLHFEVPNPNINFDGGPFYVNQNTQSWESEKLPLRAGVSSFGVGGTNAHAVLEEAPTIEKSLEASEAQLMLFSAKSKMALENFAHKIGKFVAENPVNLADLSYTLSTARSQHEIRSIGIYQKDSGKIALDNLSPELVKNGRKNVFMFTGSGAQYKGMGAEIYAANPVFKTYLDFGLDALNKLTGKDFKKVLFPEKDDAGHLINDNRFTQPIIYIFEYALAKLLMDLGVQPDKMIGHSTGEYVAATLAGVFSFEDGLKLVVKRAELMSKAPKGGMLTVGLSEADLKPYLNEALSLAAVNSPEYSVLAGSQEEIDELYAVLEAKDISCSKLRVSLAGHSYLMDQILDAFEEVFQEVELHEPKTDFISNYTGGKINASEATSVAYWLNHLRHTVRFSDGINSILKEGGSYNFIEVGPGYGLATFVKQILQTNNTSESKVHNIVRHPNEEENDWNYFIEKLGRLWMTGVDIDWEQYWSNASPRKISAPTYAFEKNNLIAKVNPWDELSTAFTDTKKELTDWFYVTDWKKSFVPVDSYLEPEQKNIIILTNNDQKSALVNELEKVLVGGGHETLMCSSANMSSLKQSLEEFVGQNNRIDYVIISNGIKAECFSADKLRQRLVDFGELAKIIGQFSGDSIQRIVTINNLGQPVLASDELNLGYSSSDVFTNVFTQELAEASFMSIDVNPEIASPRLVKGILHDIFYATDLRIAYRNRMRFVEKFESIQIPAPEINPVLQQEGTYVITGGLGQVSTKLAHYLGTKYKANVILLGRSKIDLNEIDEQSAFNPALEQRKTRLHFLETEGCKVKYVATNIDDLEVFSEAITEIENEFGTINGVLHTAAARLDDADTLMPVELINDTVVTKQFSAKVNGTLNIYEVFKNKQIDFVWITSSTAAVIGGVSYGAYAVANRFIDGFVQSRRCELENWYVANLDRITRDDIPIESMPDVLERTLCIDQYAQVIVAHSDFNEQIKSANTKESETEEQLDQKERPTHLSEEYIPAETEVEKEVELIWKQFFGLEKIGVNDNFFELGGDSLKALTVGRIMYRKFNVELKPKVFFKKANIKAIAEEIELRTKIKEIRLDDNDQEGKILNEITI